MHPTTHHHPQGQVRRSTNPSKCSPSLRPFSMLGMVTILHASAACALCQVLGPDTHVPASTPLFLTILTPCPVRHPCRCSISSSTSTTNSSPRRSPPERPVITPAAQDMVCDSLTSSPGLADSLATVPLGEPITVEVLCGIDILGEVSIGLKLALSHLWQSSHSPDAPPLTVTGHAGSVVYDAALVVTGPTQSADGWACEARTRGMPNAMIHVG